MYVHIHVYIYIYVYTHTCTYTCVCVIVMLCIVMFYYVICIITLHYMLLHYIIIKSYDIDCDSEDETAITWLDTNEPLGNQLGYLNCCNYGNNNWHYRRPIATPKMSYNCIYIYIYIERERGRERYRICLYYIAELS